MPSPDLVDVDDSLAVDEDDKSVMIVILAVTVLFIVVAIIAIVCFCKHKKTDHGPGGLHSGKVEVIVIEERSAVVEDFDEGDEDIAAALSCMPALQIGPILAEVG